jgi:hypothetical protein
MKSRHQILKIAFAILGTLLLLLLWGTAAAQSQNIIHNGGRQFDGNIAVIE